VTYVIAEPCIGEKNGACVDVCPAACIHTTPDAPQNYIDPVVCIECEQCVLVCPVDAVFLDKDLPDEWRRFEAINADFFQANKPVSSLQLADATRMVEAVGDYAARAGLLVAIVVLDRNGSALTSSSSSPDSRRLQDATRKAYTALMYGVATHELKPSTRPLWHQATEIDAARVLLSPGGYPIVEGVDTLGAVGVAGASPQQDIVCCQAAVGARLVAHSH
jgi:ferredoxin